MLFTDNFFFGRKSALVLNIEVGFIIEGVNSYSAPAFMCQIRAVLTSWLQSPL